MKKTIKARILLILFVLFGCNIEAQIITTVVGTGNQSYTGDSLPGLSTAVAVPEGGMSIDQAGNLYFCDYGNNRVRKLNFATGLVTNIAGTGSSGFSGDGGQAKLAKLNGPVAVAVDKVGNVYIADYSNYRIRKVSPSGIITTIAGTGAYAYNGDGIQATSAALFEPTGIAVDTAGHVYFSHLGDMRVRRVDKSTGIISTVVGTGTTGYNGDNILAVNAQLNFPYGIAFDKNNNLYVSDKFNYRIRKVSAATGNIITIVGNGVYGNNGDGGLATSASIEDVWDVDVDSLGNIYLADRSDNKIRKVTNGTINTVAGNGTAAYGGDGGLATSANLSNCSGVVANRCGAFYICDRFNNRIRKVSSYNFSATSVNAKCYAVCNGTVGINANGGMAPYTYTWTGGLGSGTSYANVCAGNYVVTSTDGKGCKEQLNIIISQPTQFLITNITQTNVTCNNNGAAIAPVSGGAGSPNVYTWSGSTSTTAIGTGLAPGIHTVSVTDANGCIATKTVSILFTPTLALTVNVTNASCGSLGSATATSNGAAQVGYAWSTSATGSVVSNINPGIYNVTATDNNGCMVTSQFSIALNTPTFASVPICYVTVDSVSKYNVITWDKAIFATADSFFIYRETGTNIYKLIESRPYAALSQFVDTVKTLYFPNTGNPNVGTYRYKLKTRNSCGEKSEFSPYHNTLFIVNTNGSFSWPQLYSIEGGANPVISYVLERDNQSNGNWQAIGSVAATQQFIIDPNYSNFQNTASWRVRTQWGINCIPTVRSSSNGSFSSSNVVSNNAVGIKENNLNNSVVLFPNPSTGIFEIKNNLLSPGKLFYEIKTVTGEIIATGLIDEKKSISFDMTDKPAGVYLMSLEIGNERVTKKLIVTK
ncbi:MAG: T9SS type A sorting domain-containing protein [Bacteroidetes bacterium]|nr:T9SS type A sorting domain-containing protein [Bacteroidota bacterium]